MNDIIIIEKTELDNYKALDEVELVMLDKAARLINCNFPEHALLEIWNAGIHNIRRRIEAYSIDMFLSSISNLSGRRTYKENGDTIAERWSGVDDENLLKGAEQIGVINKKAAKALEMIEWLRNHASPSHDSDDAVKHDDVIGIVLIIKKNLFELPMPDPGYSPVSLLEPIKNTVLNEEQIELLKQQIECYKNKDIRMLFGFSLDVICKGEEPSYSNIIKLFSKIWDKSTEDLKSSMGMKFHNYYMFESKNDSSSNVNAKSRVYETLIKVNGIKYIPDPTRARIYRKLADNLRDSKNMIYGWSAEYGAAKALAQAGTNVPSIAFEEVYQEILSVWCGNYWGRSDAHSVLKEFIYEVGTQDKLKFARFFLSNSRVREELFQLRPKKQAVALLNSLIETMTVESHKAEIQNIIDEVNQI